MRHVIVGASAAGMAAAEAIRKRDPAAEIVVLTDERHPPYYRPLIPYLLYAGKTPAEIVREPRLTPARLELLSNAHAARLDPAARCLVLADGSTLSYDRLLLATGARPLRPEVAGLNGPGVFTLRTWDDALGLAAAAQGARSAVILGAGRIGLKSAFALRHLDLRVTVVEQLDRLVPQQLDPPGAAIFAQAVAQAGIETVLGHTLVQVQRRGAAVTSVVLDDGRQIDADLVVVGVGVRANLDLALTGGLSAGRGLLVDAHLRASAPDVYAAGDVVETTDIVTGEAIVSGIWTNAAAMGRVAGDNMAGGESTYLGGFALLNAMELGGLPVISVGAIHRAPGDGVEVFAERRGLNYRKLVFQGNRLIGLMLVGEVERAGVYQALIRERADVSGLRRELIGPRFHYGHYLHSRPGQTDRYVWAG